MKNSISNVLLQPYPFYYNRKVAWIVAGLLFFMTLFFGYVFEPFGVYIPEHKMSYFWITFIHALTPSFVVGLFSIIVRTPKIENNWNIAKEALLIALFLLVVGSVQFLIRDFIYDNANNWSWHYLYEEIRNTFLVGMLFAATLISLNFNRLNTKNSRKARDLKSTNVFVQPITNATYNTKGIVKIADLQLDIDNFIFAKAEGNYLEIHLIGEKTNKVLKRMTIKELEFLVKAYSNVIKTHRSYLVNLHHIKNVSGNAQGYKLQFNNYDGIIPVSRNMISHFDTRMKNI